MVLHVDEALSRLNSYMANSRSCSFDGEVGRGWFGEGAAEVVAMVVLGLCGDADERKKRDTLTHSLRTSLSGDNGGISFLWENRIQNRDGIFQCVDSQATSGEVTKSLNLLDLELGHSGLSPTVDTGGIEDQYPMVA